LSYKAISSSPIAGDTSRQYRSGTGSAVASDQQRGDPGKERKRQAVRFTTQEHTETGAIMEKIVICWLVGMPLLMLLILQYLMY